MPLLSRYIASILANSTADAFEGGGDMDKYQETQVLHYCHSIYAKHLASLNEDQVMELARDEGIFARLAHVLHTFGGVISESAMDAGLVALSGMCGTEYFSIHKKQMVLADDKYQTLVGERNV